MPSSNVGDTAPSTNQHTRSHADTDRYAGQVPHHARPQPQSATHPVEHHRSSSRGPRGGNSERTTRANTTSSDESGSRPGAELKGPSSDPYPRSNDRKDAGGTTRRTRATSVSTGSNEDLEITEKQQQPPLSKRDNVSRSSTKDDSSTRNMERKSYSQVAFDQSLANIKALDNTGPRSSQAPAVNPETKPVQFGSLPSKEAGSNLPRAPTDNVSAIPTTQNTYVSSSQSNIIDDSTAPPVINATNHTKLLPPAIHSGPSPDSPVMPFPGRDPTQQSRSTQQLQQQGESKGGITEFIRSAWTGSSGRSPRDKPMDERSQYESQLFNLQADLKRYSKENRSLRQKLQELEHENSRLKDNNRGLQHELVGVQREMEEAKSLSEIRGKELVGAQVFLTKADSLSMSDVIDKVGILNDEIFQTAALFSEGLHHRKHEFSQESLQTFYDQSRPIIGEHMMGLLHAQSQNNEADQGVNPLLAQSVVSTFLVQFCISKLNSWCPSDPRISAFLAAVYDQMRHTEDQAVFGRWRSLLRVQIRPSTEEWRNELTKSLDKILKLAFWDAPSEVKRGFEHKLGPIFKALEDVRIALYEKFTSADLEPFFVEPSGPFQSWMEDAYGDGRQAQNNLERTEKVAGTTCIGLKRFKIVRSETGESRDSFEVVVPPKVVLESTLKEALDPPPPTRKSRKRVTPEDGGR